MRAFLVLAEKCRARLSGPVLWSSTVFRFRHFRTVLGLMPQVWLSSLSAAFDRCIAFLTACVVVAYREVPVPIVPPSIARKGSYHQSVRHAP